MGVSRRRSVQFEDWDRLADILIGVDPGTKTGLAIKRRSCGFVTVTTCGIVAAMDAVLCEFKIAQECGDTVLLRFEDARRRSWFGAKGREALQGAGSIKRDCSIWQEFCELHGIPFEAVAPAKGQTKWSAEYFARVTGWIGRTSEHSRDAALLIL